MKPSACLLALVALTGCATTPLPPIEGPVGIGQEAYSGGPLVTPLQVIEDSRCPMNARCIWAGRIVVRVAIRGHTGRKTWKAQRDLVLGEPQAIADGTIALIAVTPGRMAGSDTNRPDYRFTFDFQGGI